MATRVLLMLRETSPWALAGAAASVALLWLVAWTLEWAWWTPRRLDRALRAQGLKGTRYRLFTGDLRETARVNREARKNPLPLGCHDIAPRVQPMLHSAMKEYGKLSFTWFGPTPRVMIPDPELVKEVLSNKFGHFGKPRSSRIGKLLANGVVNHDGEKWAKHRRILNPAFHHEKIKRMLPVFSTCCIETIIRWENSMPSEGSSEIDVWPEFQNLTGDVISRTAFGSNYQEGRRIFQLQGELAERLIQSIQTIFIPGYWFLPTKNNRRMKEIDLEIRKILREIIGKREKATRNGETNNDDLLGLLLESNTRQSNGNASLGLTTEDVIEECKLFYFAGMETTSVLLTWTLIVLSMHPEWQERAREEVLSHFGRTRPDFDSLSRLKIVTMILYEVLRLYPPVILLTRRTYKEMELGGITYPSGVSLLLPIIFIHHDPNIWGKDASEFNPQRFEDGISNATKHQAAFFPFGWGPRICIGQNFALLEAKMALCTILQRFSFELSPSYTHAPYTVITLHPQHGAQIRLKKL
ncbi:cytochrome P450 72A15 isoform X3 [Sorghum bicolor]|uniref:cytochrome P450 72A15 isoform X3 n=1 Tax=Sorghum bicolor TaxID=4558 RepID=UPI000B424F44|nr:cytochrome P450 72A15 isoform X3 [Sorghum bicolor]|eukprot:XP_021311612.1 cytochrome P450 72A15 isoform X3 [Sorghum bicolor]